ncbi:uncharacterized protein LOC110705673 [Chenopodium quinoa]|uniref:Late embryogenesis abundant protein LEA-2 subgroup domain-containing protein n=1 Tax=Chenopodium quinoa TaxID=63459 RepID=A0A803LBZ4_CHEQI|nr:uncharacterized protein LOC110705673 [Chenopodium quinoa]
MMMEMEEEEYGSNYYVQSPSSVSHHRRANSTTTTYTESGRNPQLLSLPSYNEEEDQDQCYPTKPLLNNQDHNASSIVARTSTFSGNLSRCSSSRASTTSFIHQNDVMRMTNVLSCDHANGILSSSAGKTTNIVINKNNDMVVPVMSVKKMGKVDDEEELYNFDNDEGKCWKYLSFNTYSSYVWIGLQLLWRFLLSAMLALLVFYLVTKPPPPHISVKVIGVNQFELTEGVDLTGVATNFLSCNLSMALIIDNRSKVFGLHILPPIINVYYGRVPFVMSRGANMYVRSREWREMSVSAGTTKKAMYGGGRNMEDMLNSQTGLPLFVTLKFSSYIRVVQNLIQSHFHHQAHCLLLLRNLNDQQHHTTLTHSVNTTCNLLTS